MAKYTVLIKGNVQNANAFQGYFVGMSTPNTAISFAEHIKLGILKNIKEIEYNGFENYNPDDPINSFDFIKVSDVMYGFDGITFDLHAGHEKFVSAMKGSWDINPPIVDNKTFSSDFFILFTLDFRNVIANFDVSILKEMVVNTVNMSKFSGGKIFNAFKENIEVMSSRLLKEEFNDVADFLDKKLKKTKNSWFIIEKFSDNYLNHFNAIEEFSKLTDLDKILYLIKRENWNTKKLKEYNQIEDGYYVPMTIGYRFFNDFKEPQDKFKFKNSYSEPILSVVRCRSLDSFLRNPIHEVFWNNELKEDIVLSTAKSIN